MVYIRPNAFKVFFPKYPRLGYASLFRTVHTHRMISIVTMFRLGIRRDRLITILTINVLNLLERLVAIDAVFLLFVIHDLTSIS